MKKIMALTLMLVMFVSTVCFAAVSSSGSKSRPSTSTKSSSQTAPSGSYKSTAPANSISNTAPAKQTTPSVQPNSQPQSSGSSFLRNASMIGGGMLAGSLLGNMFGSGNMGGMGSSIFGMLINLLMVGGVVMGIRYLWNKYKSKDKDRRM